jgi:hypothetical protein
MRETQKTKCLDVCEPIVFVNEIFEIENKFYYPPVNLDIGVKIIGVESIE